MKSFYDVLGVGLEASDEEIRAAFRARASEHHPDKGGSDEVMAEINRAYECLSDLTRRASYDQSGYDPGAQTIDTEVRNLIIAAFSVALDKEAANIVEFAVGFVRHHIGALQSQGAICRSKREKIEKRRNRVRVKSGANLFEILLDGQLHEVKKALGQIEAQMEIHEHALETLKNYESDSEALVRFSPFYITGTTTI